MTNWILWQPFMSHLMTVMSSATYFMYLVHNEQLFFMNSSIIYVVRRHVLHSEHNYIETFEITRMKIE